MPQVRLLTTGGTIASRRSSDGSVIAADTAHDIVNTLADHGDIDVEAEEVFRINSYTLSVDDVFTLARHVLDAVAAPAVDGVVVTHGTDTMEESAYLVDLFYDGHKPVVFTGAQRGPGEQDSDGPRNLRDAVRLAGTPAAANLGVVVAMAGHVVPARYAAKVHTQGPQAFGSTGPGPLAEVTAARVTVGALPRYRGTFSIEGVTRPLPRVDVVPMYIGADGTLIRAACHAGATGIVLEAFGAGNANPDVVAEVAAAVAQGVVVLVSSRCHSGPVEPIYGAGGGVDLVRAGAHFAADLRAPKARLLLMAALSAGEPSGIEDQLRRHLN